MIINNDYNEKRKRKLENIIKNKLTNQIIYDQV